MRSANAQLTSRLATVEAARAIHRVRQLGGVAEARLADAEREVEHLWARSDIWEVPPQVCETARHIALGKLLRTAAETF
jgi:hypothetical protein